MNIKIILTLRLLSAIIILTDRDVAWLLAWVHDLHRNLDRYFGSKSQDIMYDELKLINI